MRTTRAVWVRTAATLLVVAATLAVARRPLAAQEAPPAPTLEFAFEARVGVQTPLVVGQSSHGLRRVVPITGGTFEGPAIRGRVVPGGADWQYVRLDGVLALEAKYTLQTSDSVLVMVTNRGVRRGPPEVIARLARGERVDPGEYYFRTTAEFEAPVGGRYAWLNESVFIGIAERRADAAIIRFYRVR